LLRIDAGTGAPIIAPTMQPEHCESIAAAQCNRAMLRQCSTSSQDCVCEETMRLLLVEDEPEMSAMLAAALRRQGFVVDAARSLAVAEEAISSAEHDAVILDRKLPDGEGLSLLPKLRARERHTPVIVLSAMGSTEERVAGLDIGADDYLAKPFSIDELLARLRAVLRRPTELRLAPVVVANLSLDLENRQASVDGVPLELPRRELLVLEALMRRSGRSVTRAVLEEAVYGFDDEIASNTLDAHISRLRRRIAEAGAHIDIHAIRGIGYLIRPAA
jgi:DNA-binding response OmpR family regulator